MSVTALNQQQGEVTSLQLHSASTKAAIQGLRIRSPTKPQNVNTQAACRRICGFFVFPVPQGKEQDGGEMTMLKIEHIFPCGHIISEDCECSSRNVMKYLNSLPPRPLEQKIVRLDDAEQKGIKVTESMGNNKIKLALIDNYSNCPTCWEKAKAIEEKSEYRKLYRKLKKAFDDVLKKGFLTAFLMLIAISTVTACDLYTAIGEVESHNSDQAVGDGGKAVGRYQIHMTVIEDVNELCGTNYTAEDRKDPEKAREIMEKYIGIWAKHYEKTQKKTATDEIKARIWNGGPYGWRKKATEKYWEKVQKAMKERQ